MSLMVLHSELHQLQSVLKMGFFSAKIRANKLKRDYVISNQWMHTYAKALAWKIEWQRPFYKERFSMLI